MTTSAIILIVIAVLAASVYVAYLVATVKGDGFNLAGRRPPMSHAADLFDPNAGPRRLA